MHCDAAPTGAQAEQPGGLPVRAAKQDVPSWIESVYESYARELWAVYYTHCCDPDLARDAVQEAFLRLHHQDRALLRDVKAWLVRVGVNWIRDVVRRRRHAAAATASLDSLPGSLDVQHSILESHETQVHVRQALRRLRQEDREVLVLRYALDWSSARIAETLGIAPAAVDMRLSRARRRLAEQFELADLVP